MTRLSDHRASLIISDSDSYVDYQTRMVEYAKDIAKLAGEMVSKFFHTITLYFFFFVCV